MSVAIHLRTSSLSPRQLDQALRGLRQMTRWFRDGEPPQVALEKIVSFFHRLDRPVYLGFIAVEVKYSLEQTRAMLDVLHEAGVVRPLTVEEKRAQGLDERGDVWVLVEKARPSKANW